MQDYSPLYNFHIVAGLKAGGIAAFGCGVLGFTGGTVLKRKEEMAEEASTLDEPKPDDIAEDEPLTEGDGADSSGQVRKRRLVDVDKED